MSYLKNVKEESKLDFEITSYAESLDEWIVELLDTDPEMAMSWWYEAFDNKLWYILPWQLILVWWVTGTGKSSFVNQICQNISNQWLLVGKFVLEDRFQDRKKEEVYFELGKIRKKNWMKNYPMNEFMINAVNVDQNLLQTAKENLLRKNKNILEIKKNIEDRINIDRLEILVKQLVEKWCKLISIDHLDEFELTWDASRDDLKIKQVMYKIKDIGRRYWIAIILVAHYKKLGKDTKPDDESFSWWNAIAQVANKVIHLYRNKLDENWITDVIITKNRWTAQWTWTLELNYDWEIWSYTNIKSKKQIDKESKLF